MRVLCWLLLAAAVGHAQPYPTFTGVLARIDEKVIVLKVEDDRELDFRRTRKTHFAKGAEPQTLKPGDVLSIEATKDIEGGLAAVNVFREKVPKTAEEKLVLTARMAAAEFTSGLPNYVCREVVTRKVGEGRPMRWRVRDTITANVVMENGYERYDDVQVNGRPSSTEEAGSRGVWSSGEFGSLLGDVFSPRTAAEFRYRADEQLAGRKAARYNFDVERANSHWNLEAAEIVYAPAYKGAVWLERESARALRVETEAVDLPSRFPLDTAEMSADYDYVALADGASYLLPVRAAVLTCERGKPRLCARNEIEFRDYRRYTGQSSITFQP